MIVVDGDAVAEAAERLKRVVAFASVIIMLAAFWGTVAYMLFGNRS